MTSNIEKLKQNQPLSGVERIKVIIFVIFLLHITIIGAMLLAFSYFGATGTWLPGLYITPLPILVISGIYVMKVDKNLSPLITTKKWFKRYLVGALMFVLYPFTLHDAHWFFTPAGSVELKAPHHPEWVLLSSNDIVTTSYLNPQVRTGRRVETSPSFAVAGFRPLSKTTVNNYFDLVEAGKGEFSVRFENHSTNEYMPRESCDLTIYYGKEKIYQRTSLQRVRRFEGDSRSCDQYSEKSYKHMFSSRENFMEVYNAFEKLVKEDLLKLDEAKHYMQLNQIKTALVGIPLVFLLVYLLMWVYDMLFIKPLKKHRTWVEQNGIFGNK
jgi:hypothetical protein